MRKMRTTLQLFSHVYLITFTNLILLLIISVPAFCQTYYNQSFDATGEGLTGSCTSCTYTSAGTDIWTVSGPSLDANDYFNTTENIGSLEAKDLDGEFCFETDVIIISGGPDVNIIIDLSELGSQETDDYVDVSYSFDGGSNYSLIPNWNGEGNGSHTLVENWAPQIIYQTLNLSGTTDLKIKICINNDEDDEMHSIGRVLVENAASTDLCDCTSSCTFPAIGTNQILAACENLNIALVLDESGSISNSGATQIIADGVIAFADAIHCPNAKLAIIEYNTTARNVVSTYLEVDEDFKDALDDYFDEIPNQLFNNQTYHPGGSTNWQDAMHHVDDIGITPDLVIFFTDGLPTVWGENTGNMCNYAWPNNPVIANPVKLANKLKLEGTHMFMIGVGAVIQQNLEIMSGPVQFDEAINTLANSDFSIGPITELVNDLETFANDLCPQSSCSSSGAVCEDLGTIDIDFSNFPSSYEYIFWSFTHPGTGLPVSGEYHGSTFPFTLTGLPLGTYQIAVSFVITSDPFCVRPAGGCEVDLTSPELTLSCPTDPNLGPCSLETAILNAYNTWMSGFGYSGGIPPYTVESGPIPSLPPYVCGGAVNLSHIYEVSDDCGTMTCESTFTVAAATVSTMSCPNDLTADCSILEQLAYATYADFIAGGGFATGDCINTSTFILQSESSNGMSCPEIITRTYQMTDFCGNVLSCIQDIIIDDQTAPALTDTPFPGTNDIKACMADATTAEPFSATDAIMGYTDNCSAVTAELTNTNVTGTDCAWTVEYTFTIKDACDNLLPLQTYSNTGGDLEAPTLTGTPFAGTSGTNSCKADAATAAPFSATDAIMGYTDNCGAVTAELTNTNITGTDCDWTVEYTFTIKDACDNLLPLQTYSNTGSDNVAPTADALPDLGPYACYGDIPSPAIIDVTGESDNCGGTVAVAHVSDGSDPGCSGMVTRTYSLTDGCGNSVNITQTITINDNVAPTADALTALGPYACYSDIPLANINDVTGESDNCGGTVTVAHVSDGADPGCSGTVTRTYSLTDVCGNSVNITQMITINDNIIPVIGAGPADITIQCEGDLPSEADLSWTDNCDAGGTVTSVTGPLSGTSCGGTYTRTWNVSDACGNAAIEVTQTITIDDTEAPVIGAGPADITIQCEGDLPSEADLSWTDNCDAGGTVTSVTGPLSGTSCGGTYTRTWNVSDACGNAAIEVTQTITIDDTEAPVIGAGPADITIQCEGDLPSEADLSWTDNCDAGGTVTSVTGPLSGTSCGGTYTRTWNVSDACGNAAIEVTQTITIDDTEAPVIGAGPADITIQCEGDLPSEADLSWTDNCDAGGTVTSVTGPLSGTSCGGTYTRTWNVSDACGNAAIEVTQTITIDDTEAPVIGAGPADITIQCEGDLPSEADLSWTDNCDAGGTVTSVTGPLSGTSCGGTYTRTWNVSDACGNAAIEVTQTITIDDTEAPVIGAGPADITIQCEGDLPSEADLSWTDNCDAGGTVTSVTGPLSGTSCGGTYTRTWNVSDACGNAAIEVTQTITIDDTEAPVIGAGPADITIQCEGDLPSEADLSWTDNCDAGGTVTSVTGPLSGTSCGGTYTRTWNVSDACGNAAIEVTQTITIDDTEAPVIGAGPADITIQCEGDLPSEADLSWTDNCDAGGTVTSVTGPLSGTSCGGTYTRTWNVSDACGNAAIEVTQTITIDDTEAPVIGAGPADITIQCEGDLPSEADLSWTDNCDAGGTVTSVTGPLSGTSCGGTYTRTWNVSDACGNAAIEVTQTITIDDTEAPVIVAGPADITIQCEGDLPSEADLSWTDNCDAGGTVTSVTGPLSGTSCGGTYTRTWNVSDACGNAAIEVTQTITIDDTEAPVIGAGPADITIQCEGDLPSEADLSWTDNCDAGGTVTSVTGPLSGTSCGGTYTRTWNVSDACGNAAIEVTQTITIDDTEAPVIGAGPADITIQCEGDLPSEADLSWTDNCDAGGTVTSVTGPLSGTSCGGTYTRTWNVSDACGNAAIEVTQTITIDDTEAPVIGAGPADITIQCEGDLPSEADLSWTDNCDAGGTVTSVTGPLSGTSCGGTYTRTWNVSDACGNAAIEVTQTITINDTEAPVIGAGPADITIQCEGDLPSEADLSWTDNCDAGGTVTSVTGPLSGTSCGGTYTRTWNVSDACGNAAIEVTQTITIDDTEAPVIGAGPADITIQCEGDLPSEADLSWTDNCDAGGTVTSVTGPLSGTSCGGTYTRTWNVSDACGNAAIEVTQTITINDTEAPVIVAGPADITIQCEGDLPSEADLSWTDNCDAGGTVTSVTGPLSGTSCGGTYTRTWNVSDACGNAAIEVTQTITIDDTEAPVIGAGPADITIQCEGDLPSEADLSWTDNCDAGGTVTSVTGPLSGTSCGGTYTRTWNVSDACGNAAIEVTQTITIDDTEAPVIVAGPADITIQCEGDLPSEADLSWTDNCDAGGTVTSVTGPLSGTSCGGTYTRTWNVSDACGNAAIEVTQTITIDDTEAPVIGAGPADITIQCEGDLPSEADLSWTDNCDAGGTVTSVTGPLSGTSCGGTYTRTWNVSDACGNAAIEVTQTITINDTEAPVIGAGPADITIQCEGDLPSEADLSWTDNCDAGGTVTSVTGPLSGTSCGGTYTRTWNVSDACGNAAIEVTQTITIDDTEAPVIGAGPADITIQCEGDLPSEADLSWTDNCDAGGTVTSVTGPLSGTSCGGTYTRTWNVSDACGNAAIEVTQTITIDDTEAPVIGAGPADITIQCEGDLPSEADLSWTDNCDAGGTVTSVTGPLSGTSCGGTYTRTWNVSDACGNAAIEVTQTITIDDTEAPVIGAGPADITIQCEGDLPSEADLSWTDNCDAGGTVTSVTGPLSGTSCGGTYTRTWNVSDACGNAAIEVTQTITIDDTEAPVIGAGPADITIQCEGDLPSEADLSWTDNCDAGGTVTSVTGPLSGTSCGGTYTRTWNVSDACGNAAIEVTQTITIDDTEAPVIGAGPADITIQCEGDLPSEADLSWTDNCDAGGTVTSVTGPLSGTSCGGTYTRTWNVSDACGNAAIEVTQTITIDDTEAPVIVAGPADITIQCEGDLPSEADLSWTDNCDAGGTVTSVTGPLSGTSCGGTYTRTWNVSDACGNAAIEVTQTITIDDTEAPVIGLAQQI